MTDPKLTPFVNSVFHPSDFTEASNRAFAHALAAALVRQTQFTILHVGGDESDWKSFPVRQTLERWGFLAPDSPRSAVLEKLSLRVKKVRLEGRSPADAIHHYLLNYPHDLIVLATEGRHGIPQWIRRSVAERIADESNTKTLFVPQSGRGFIDIETGDLSMARILVPVSTDPTPVHAIEYANRIIPMAGSETTEVVLLHVGDPGSIPDLSIPDPASGVWRIEHRAGDVVREILRFAADFEPDLIVMATAGHEGILDALRGTVTDQVLRSTPCPLLAVPPVGLIGPSSV